MNPPLHWRGFEASPLLGGDSGVGKIRDRIYEAEDDYFWMQLPGFFHGVTTVNGFLYNFPPRLGFQKSPHPAADDVMIIRYQYAQWTHRLFLLLNQKDHREGRICKRRPGSARSCRAIQPSHGTCVVGEGGHSIVYRQAHKIGGRCSSNAGSDNRNSPGSGMKH